MLVERVMKTDVVTAYSHESVAEVLTRMRSSRLRMLPILNDNNIVVGVISTYTIIEKIVPGYIVSGDLNQIAYAPDMGILRRQYRQMADKKAADVMDEKPLVVSKGESLLSVAAAMLAFTKHEYAAVVDDKQHLLGIVSAGDILDRLTMIGEGESDA